MIAGAAICRNVTSDRRRRSDMHKRKSILPQTLKRAETYLQIAMGAQTGIAKSSSSVNSRYDPGRQNVEYELRLECRPHIWQIEHGAAATAIFAIPLQHAISKYNLCSSLGHILHTSMRETRATVTYVIPLQHATSKCCCGESLADIFGSPFVPIHRFSIKVTRNASQHWKHPWGHSDL